MEAMRDSLRRRWDRTLSALVAGAAEEAGMSAGAARAGCTCMLLLDLEEAA